MREITGYYYEVCGVFFFFFGLCLAFRKGKNFRGGGPKMAEE